MIKIKKWLFCVVSDDDNKSLSQKCLEIFFIILIVANVLAVAVESSFSEKLFLYKFEQFSVGIFTLEYLIRFWTADLKYPNIAKSKARKQFIFSLLGLVDLCSILPFFILIYSPFRFDTRILRIIRLFRLFRLLKLIHFLDSFKIIGRVLTKRRNELFVTFFIVFIILILSSTFIYEIEHQVQPDKFPSVMSSMWWAVATLTTIGYGDIYPITNAGKIFSAIVSILGIGMVAMPTGIISSGFMEEVKDFENKKLAQKTIPKKEFEIKYCPNCGLKLNEIASTFEIPESSVAIENIQNVQNLEQKQTEY